MTDNNLAYVKPAVIWDKQHYVCSENYERLENNKLHRLTERDSRLAHFSAHEISRLSRLVIKIWRGTDRRLTDRRGDQNRRLSHCMYARLIRRGYLLSERQSTVSLRLRDKASVSSHTHCRHIAVMIVMRSYGQWSPHSPLQNITAFTLITDWL